MLEFSSFGIKILTGVPTPVCDLNFAKISLISSGFEPLYSTFNKSLFIKLAISFW